MTITLRVRRYGILQGSASAARWMRRLCPSASLAAPSHHHQHHRVIFFPAVPLATPSRLSHSTAPLSTPPPPASSASPVAALAAQVQPFIPPTFTSIQQLSRQVPAELMEQISSPECGGLRQLLARHPDCYESKQIGQVHVVRRRAASAGVVPHSGKRNQKVNTRLTSVVGGSHFSSDEVSLHAASHAQSVPPNEDAALAKLQELFPSYLVPVKALWATVAESAEADMKAEVLTALRSNAGELLTFFEHPEYRSVNAPKRSATQRAGQRSTNAELDTAVLENGYVQLCSPSHSVTSPQQLESTGNSVRIDSSEFSAKDVPTQQPTHNVLQRLSEYEVQPYEWYRVARVLPTARSEVLFDSELHDSAAVLLPPGRDVWQVLLSAPHLFTVRYEGVASDASTTTPEEPPCRATNTSTTTTTTSSSVSRVLVRFRLDPRFIPAGVAFVREPELLRQLEEVAVDREENQHGLSTRQRRRKRKLQRQLAYLRNPTPYFDDRVLTQHLFDLLPVRDGVHQSALLGALPAHAVAAFPPNVTDLLKERTDLFRLSDARHGVLVQRADAPADTAQRTVDSVTGEEVLQCLFAAYSTRSDPRAGTTMSRNLPRLPRLVRERLFAMSDVVQELLCQYPEKVALLAPAEGNAAAAAASLDERAARELQNVRGRRDFLVPFRFVGEWEAKLMERYTRQQEKELAKSRKAHHRPASSRRPRHY